MQELAAPEGTEVDAIPEGISGTAPPAAVHGLHLQSSEEHSSALHP